MVCTNVVLSDLERFEILTVDPRGWPIKFLRHSKTKILMLGVTAGNTVSDMQKTGNFLKTSPRIHPTIAGLSPVPPSISPAIYAAPAQV